MLKNAGWILVSEEEAQPGDVCSYLEHTFIYAGGNEVWDQATGVVSTEGDPPTGGPISSWNYYKSNFDLDVWRRPDVNPSTDKDSAEGEN